MKKITLCGYARFATSEQLGKPTFPQSEKITKQNIFQYMHQKRSVKIK